MGILNVTPDSFSDGGSYPTSEDAVAAGLKMLAEGADVLDIGGESTRPGSRTVSAAEQLNRVLPVIRLLRGETDALLSVDTRDPTVGEAAIDAGADIINEVSACKDPGWAPVLRRTEAPVVLMHMRGTPEDMQHQTLYPDGVMAEIRSHLAERMSDLESEGISKERFILDPGVGFAKETHHNLQILRTLAELTALGRPVLVGASRKLFLGKLLEKGGESRGRNPRDRDIGTVAANVVALINGASILRVHNVPYTRDLVDVIEGMALHGEPLPDTEQREILS